MPHEAAAIPLTLDVSSSDGIVTVLCHGKLIYGFTEVLSSRVSPLIPGSKKILLDLTDLTIMDSMGVGTLVRLYVSAKSKGSCLELINVGPRIRQLLGITNLLSVLTDMCEQGINLRF
jgi:anti-sigma B factor antagonist